MSPEPKSPPDMQMQRALSRLGSLLSEKWTLERLIGIGGMAAVYEARHHNGRSVAIKILHTEFVKLEEARERFLEEAYAANQISHDGTVKVLDDGVTDDDAPFLIMELLDGETLEDLCARGDGVLSAAVALPVAAQLLHVLSAAHRCGIVHRDIKPENVFITTGGDIKLLDFGIARMVDSRRTQKTQIGNTMGTPAFMPPEQARGRWEEVDARSDLWAVGATIYAALTGRTVHEADTNNELLLASMTHPAPSVSTYAPALSEDVARVVDRSLSFDRSDRFESAEEMLDALSEAYGEALIDEPVVPSLGTFPPVVTEREGETSRSLVRAFSTQRERPVPGLPGLVSLPFFDFWARAPQKRKPLILLAATGLFCSTFAFFAVSWLYEESESSVATQSAPSLRSSDVSPADSKTEEPAAPKSVSKGSEESPQESKQKSGSEPSDSESSKASDTTSSGPSLRSTKPTSQRTATPPKKRPRRPRSRKSLAPKKELKDSVQPDPLSRRH